MKYKVKRFSALKKAAKIASKSRGNVASRVTEIMSKTPGQHTQEFSHDLIKNAIDNPIGGITKGVLPGGTIASPVIDKISDQTERQVYKNVKVGRKSISEWTKPIRERLHKRVKPISEAIGNTVDGALSGRIPMPGINM